MQVGGVLAVGSVLNAKGGRESFPRQSGEGKGNREGGPQKSHRRGSSL